MELKIKRNKEKEIVCSEHNLKAYNICLKENCHNKKRLICNSCECNHEENKNRNLNFILNKNILENIYDKKMKIFDKEKRIENLKLKYINMKKLIIKYLDLSEKSILKYFEENFEDLNIKKELKFLEEKKNQFENDNNNLMKLNLFVEEVQYFLNIKTKNFNSLNELTNKFEKKFEQIEQLVKKELIFELNKTEKLKKEFELLNLNKNDKELLFNDRENFKMKKEFEFLNIKDKKNNQFHFKILDYKKTETIKETKIIYYVKNII